MEVLTSDMELLLDDLVDSRGILLLMLAKLLGNTPDNVRRRKLVNVDLRNVSYLIDVWGPVQELFF